jgi:hypothetical protein
MVVVVVVVVVGLAAALADPAPEDRLNPLPFRVVLATVALCTMPCGQEQAWLD